MQETTQSEEIQSWSDKLGVLRRFSVAAALCVVAATGLLWWTSGSVRAGGHDVLSRDALSDDRNASRALAATGGVSMRGPTHGADGVGPIRASHVSDLPAGRPVRVAQRSSTRPLKVKGKVLRGKLNVNKATEEQFRMLPGIGASKARRIVQYRQKRGMFRRVRDLRQVQGIGANTRDRLAPYLSVQGETTLKLE